MVAGNATGNHRLTAFMIGKFEKLRAFKHLIDLPVQLVKGLNEHRYFC